MNPGETALPAASIVREARPGALGGADAANVAIAAGLAVAEAAV